MGASVGGIKCPTGGEWAVWDSLGVGGGVPGLGLVHCLSLGVVC